MAVNKSDIKYYLTSLEESIAQSYGSQSIGGYISTTLLYPETTLSVASVLTTDTTSFSLTNITNFSGLEYVGINNEVIQVPSISSTSIDATTRSLNERVNAHDNLDRVWGLSRSGLFNTQFNVERKQFRCIAIKNTSTTETAFGLTIYLLSNSYNQSSNIRIAIETPQADYESSSATGGSEIQLIDSSLIGQFLDDHFEDCLLSMTSGSNSGQARIVSSFDSATGTFVLDSSMPSDIESGDTYTIDPTPAQRLASGIISPSINSGLVTTFQSPSAASPLGINVNGERDHGDDLQANDVIYVWIERTLVKNAMSKNANSGMIGIRYSDT